MTTTEKLKNDLCVRIEQLKHIRHKVQHLNGFSSSSTLKVFDNRLKKRQDYFQNAYDGGANWNSYRSISSSEDLTHSIIVGQRLEIFALEVEFEMFALKCSREFFGFYNPDRFMLFGLSPELVYNKGYSGGYYVDSYARVRDEINKDPSLILKEREKVTQYLIRGSETCAYKKQGKPFPIDLTVPYGY